jgi:hypothetical protein
MEYIVDVDSSQRDPTTYPKPNDYIVNFNTPLYNVTNISLITARIPNTQYLINRGNKQFLMNDNGVQRHIILNEGTYANGGLLASNLLADLSSQSSIDSVMYNPATRSLDIGSPNNIKFLFYSDTSNGFVGTSNVGTPYNILGFNGEDTNNASNLYSNVINLDGTLSIILRVTNGDRDFDKDLYINNGAFSIGDSTYGEGASPPLESSYLGRILCNGTDFNTHAVGKVIEFNGNVDKVEEKFLKGPEHSIEKLRFRFYWNNCNKLIPYEFGGRNHILKIKITCSLNKLESLSAQKADLPSLPDPIKLPYLEPPDRFTKQQKFIIIFCVLGLILGLLVITKKPSS